MTPTRQTSGRRIPSTAQSNFSTIPFSSTTLKNYNKNGNYRLVKLLNKTIWLYSPILPWNQSSLIALHSMGSVESSSQAINQHCSPLLGAWIWAGSLGGTCRWRWLAGGCTTPSRSPTTPTSSSSGLCTKYICISLPGAMTKHVHTAECTIPSTLNRNNTTVEL